MADRIEINFTANVREVTRGTDQIADGLKDTERALEDVGDQGKESLDKVTDAQDDATSSAKNLGGSIGGDLTGAFDKLDGTASGALDAVASGLSGIAAIAAPGFGAAIGVLATEGIGAISEELRTAQRETEELKAQFSSLYQSAAADGRTFIDEAQIQAEQLKITFDPDTTRYDQAKKDAAELGLTVQEVIRAQAGSQADLNTVLERSNQLEQDRAALVSDVATLRAGPLEQAERQGLLTAQEINARYGDLKGIQDENAAKASEFLATEQARTEEIQKANKALADTPKTVPTKLEVDDSELEEKVSRNRTVRLRIEGYSRTGQQIL